MPGYGAGIHRNRAQLSEQSSCAHMDDYDGALAL